MKYSIAFSSRTGNTAQLAKVIGDLAPAQDCVYFGEQNEKALTAPMLFVGFWTDKSVCDTATKAFLKTLHDKKVFLFGTSGFGGDETYFEKVIDATKQNLDETVQVVASFMCQGKMPPSVLERYEAMLPYATDTAHVQEMIDNFHAAATHPDIADFDRLKNIINTL